jgi:hypothetical protein
MPRTTPITSASRGEERDDERGPCPVQHPDEEIAPGPVDTEPVRLAGAGWQTEAIEGAEVHIVGPVMHIRAKRGRDGQHQHDEDDTIPASAHRSFRN